MNVSRFQFALNHDEPAVVLQGLDEFTQQILSDHKATESFGYYGRSSFADTKTSKEIASNIAGILHPAQYQDAIQPFPQVQNICGVLLDYSLSSPQAEELFVLWRLPNREVHRSLCASHTKALAATLHCCTLVMDHTTDNAPVKRFTSMIINRLLSEHAKHLLAQLQSGNTDLMHSTLGLIVAMARTTPRHCLDVFQKLTFACSSTAAVANAGGKGNMFADAILQRGKVVKWSCPSSDASDAGAAVASRKMSTDSRYLAALWVLLTLEAADDGLLRELFADKSFFVKRLMHALAADTADTAALVIHGMLHILQHNHRTRAYTHEIFDPGCIKKLIGACVQGTEAASAALPVDADADAVEAAVASKSSSGKRSANGNTVEELRVKQAAIYSAFMSICSMLRESMSSSGAGSAASISFSKCVAQLVQQLEPYNDLVQEKVHILIAPATYAAYIN